MNDNARAWVAALRSGEFSQGSGRLRWTGGAGTAPDDSMCCLGVACEVFRRHTGNGEWDANGIFRLDGVAVKSHPPGAVVKWLGLTTDTGYARADGTPLTDLNDDGVPFEEIADRIESEPVGMFVEVSA
jgi:hypothetical protein